MISNQMLTTGWTQSVLTTYTFLTTCISIFTSLPYRDNHENLHYRIEWEISLHERNDNRTRWQLTEFKNNILNTKLGMKCNQLNWTTGSKCDNRESTAFCKEIHTLYFMHFIHFSPSFKHFFFEYSTCALQSPILLSIKTVRKPYHKILNKVYKIPFYSTAFP